MPSLKAMFKLLDGYSVQIEKIINGTENATDKILKASKATDDFNGDLEKLKNGFSIADKSTKSWSGQMETAAASASKANGSLKALLGTVLSLAAVKKIMDVTDEYTNSTARLTLVNDGSQTSEELQRKVFDAANRSRGSYLDMAGAVSKMNLLAGDSFSSNDEAIRFTELLQKSLKVSGAGTAEQQSAFLQLTQSMAAGKLQGDEFRSVMENAPMVADAIARYMGKSKGELKDLSSKGEITADIIKEAMFSAADSIESKFETMPMTFSELGTVMGNKMLDKFAPAMEKLNGMINSSSGQKMLAVFDKGIDWIANGVNDLVDAIIRGDPVVKAFFSAAITMAGIFTAQMLVAAGATLVANWPILLVAAGIGTIIYVLDRLGVTAEQVFGAVGWLAGNVYAGFYDGIAVIWDAWLSFMEFYANISQNKVAAVEMLFTNLAINIINITKVIAEVIDEVFGTSLASTLEAYSKALQEAKATIRENTEGYISYDKFRMEMKSTVDTSNAWSEGFGKFGKAIDEWDFSAITNSLSSFATDSNPATVQGSNNGKLEVDMADEDIQYLRDLAQREYVARIAQNTLAPNIRVEFTGAISRDTDLSELGSRVGAILREEMESAPEGAY